MNRIMRKFMLLDRLNEELDDYVWIGFAHYITAHDIHFNGPEEWTCSDGCRGCYEPKSISFDISWVFDYDKLTAKLNEVKQLNKDAALAEMEAAQHELDLKEYERLKSKFEPIS